MASSFSIPLGLHPSSVGGIGFLMKNSEQADVPLIINEIYVESVLVYPFGRHGPRHLTKIAVGMQLQDQI